MIYPAPTNVADVFIDGQNLFHSVKAIFGHRHPNFHVGKLAAALCSAAGRTPGRVHFYTGMPTLAESPDWHAFWARKLAVIGREPNTTIFNPDLRYRNHRERDEKGQLVTVKLPQEKGVDVKIAIDMVCAAYGQHCDSMILVSQDSDLKEAAVRVAAIASEQRRRMTLYCAYPKRAFGRSHGVEGMTPLEFDSAFYDRCIDPANYWRGQEPTVTAAPSPLTLERPSEQLAAERASLARQFLHGDATREPAPATDVPRRTLRVR